MVFIIFFDFYCISIHFKDSHDFLWFVLFLIGFHRISWFSLISIIFLMIFIDFHAFLEFLSYFHRFSWIFMIFFDFYFFSNDLSLVLIDFHWLSLISIVFLKLVGTFWNFWNFLLYAQPTLSRSKAMSFFETFCNFETFGIFSKLFWISVVLKLVGTSALNSKLWNFLKLWNALL